MPPVLNEIDGAYHFGFICRSVCLSVRHAFLCMPYLIDYILRENLVWRSGLCDWCRGCMNVRVRVGEGYSEEFEVKVGVHQGSVLSPLLFIIVLEALSREFRSGRTSMPMTLLSSLNRLRNVSGGS